MRPDGPTVSSLTVTAVMPGLRMPRESKPDASGLTKTSWSALDRLGSSSGAACPEDPSVETRWSVTRPGPEATTSLAISLPAGIRVDGESCTTDVPFGPTLTMNGAGHLVVHPWGTKTWTDADTGVNPGSDRTSWVARSDALDAIGKYETELGDGAPGRSEIDDAP